MRAILRGRLVLKKTIQTVNNRDILFADTGIVVQGDRVVDVDAFAKVRLREGHIPVRDFDGIILPGLINAHTHLELSAFERLPHKDFVDWVLKLMDVRASAPGHELAQESLNTKRDAEDHGTAYFVNVGNDYDLNHSLGANQLFAFEQLGDKRFCCRGRVPAFALSCWREKRRT